MDISRYQQYYLRKVVYLMLHIAQLIRKSAGFTLTEIAIVLGIIGLILGAIWVAASHMYENNRQDQFTRELTQLRAALAQNSTAIDPSNLIGNFNAIGAFPSDIGVDSPWHTQLVSSASFGSNVGFISFGMPTASCIQAYIRNCGPNSNLYCGTANLANAQAAQPPTPITVATAAGQCTTAGNGNSLFWVLFNVSMKYQQF